MPVDAEIMTQSPSQTVSIYEALAEILSKPTESLSFTNSKSTDRTLFSEAPISSTTATTTTTTTSTTPLPTTTEASGELKVENSTLDGQDMIQSVNTERVNNQQPPTEASATDEVITARDEITTIPFTPDPPLNDTTEPLTTLTPTTSTVDTLNSKIDSTTTKEEFSTETTTTTNSDPLPTTTDFVYKLTNNLTRFEATNFSEIETLKTNLRLDQNRSHTKQLEANTPNNVIRKGLMKVTTLPPDYRPRFSQFDRLPILAFGSRRDDRKIDSATKPLPIDLMTNKVTKSIDEINFHSTPSVFPIYRPEFETTTIETKFTTTESAPVATTELPTATEMIFTSTITTLTEPNETTALSADETTSKRIFDLTTLTKTLINEINDLVTDTTTLSQNPNKSFASTALESLTNADPILSSTTSTLTPHKLPKSIFPHAPPTPSPQSLQTNIMERVAYAILPNNTVVRKIIHQRLTTENPYVIYGIFPNKSVVRKFRNGTIVPEDSTARIELTNIDPRSLRNPNSKFHQTENVLQRSTVADTTTLPITDQTKTVFYLLISLLNG